MPNSSKRKVYEEVLNKIQSYIEENELEDGDKLPSERELAEQLNAARSSVREALRAIELLGLIETKHGEGTFLKKYRPYQTVELLATFVLRQPMTIRELFEMKYMLEKECLTQVSEAMSHDELKEMKDEFHNYDKQHIHTLFFNTLFKKTNNRLFMKIWQLIDSFTYKTYYKNQNQSLYQKLIELIEERNLELQLAELEKYYDEKFFTIQAD